MKRSLKELTKFSIETLDGTSGKARDFLFDEEYWVIRYLEGDFGNFFVDKRVLIPRLLLEKPDWKEKHFPLSINKNEIENCPDIDKRMPVSREYEKALSKHYEIDYYWPYGYTASPGLGLYPPRPIKPPVKTVSEEDLDTSLRSFREIEGYHIHCLDGKLGHVEDLIVDDDDWQVVYLIVDTSNWMPWSKKVVLSLDWLEKISYTDLEVSVKLNTDTVKNAPEYDSGNAITEELEKELYDFYSRSFVK
jgi:sporulation protein YlmC with PRC-barrel domain